MRKFILIVLGLMMIPAGTFAGPKHGQKLQELAHKKRMKKAAKQDPGAKKHFLKKHSGG